MRMRIAWAVFLVWTLLVWSPQAPAVDGTFRGKVIEPPLNQPVAPGWIFVQGQNRMLRRVEISHAVIVFGESVPAGQHRKCNSECISAGQEVRVTARQDSAGEWRAKLVEILHLPTQVAQKPEKDRSLPNLITVLSQSWVTGRSGSASDHPREQSNFRDASVRRYNERVFPQAEPVRRRSVYL